MSFRVDIKKKWYIEKKGKISHDHDNCGLMIFSGFDHDMEEYKHQPPSASLLL